MDKKEINKYRLVIIRFYIFLGAIGWGLITDTPLIGLLGRVLSVLAVTYFFIHLHEFYLKDYFQKRNNTKKIKESD